MPKGQKPMKRKPYKAVPRIGKAKKIKATLKRRGRK